jgi:hypothetical protein
LQHFPAGARNKFFFGSAEKEKEMEGGVMDVGSAVLSALFVMLVVFVVLVALWILLRIFSSIIRGVEKRAIERAVDAGNGGK